MNDGEAILADLERFKPEGMTLNGWAVGAGVNRAVWGDIRRHANPSRRTLEKLLTFAGSSLAEFEALRIGSGPSLTTASSGEVRDSKAGWGPAQRPAIPLLAAEVGGGFESSVPPVAKIALKGAAGHSIDRPQSLNGETGLYAFQLPHAAMWPRYRQGRTLIVAPDMAVKPGDDALLVLHNPSGPALMVAVLGEWVTGDAETATIRQFNPDEVFRLDRADIANIHRVVGEAI